MPSGASGRLWTWSRPFPSCTPVLDAEPELARALLLQMCTRLRRAESA